MLRMLCLSTVLLAALHAPPGRAQEGDASAGAAIREVISEQIAALRDDDFARAFSFASPSIKRIFGDSANFGAMVQNGYPMVWRPADVRFSGLNERAGRVVQSVLVTDQQGVLHIVDYEMIEGASGWRVNGVTIRRAGDAGA